MSDKRGRVSLVAPTLTLAQAIEHIEALRPRLDVGDVIAETVYDDGEPYVRWTADLYDPNGFDPAEVIGVAVMPDLEPSRAEVLTRWR